MNHPSSAPPSTQLTLLLGGVRSGKSAKAVALAGHVLHAAVDVEPTADTKHITATSITDPRVLFIATAQPFDQEMSTRIGTHRRERPVDWDTLESPIDLARDIERALHTTPIPYSSIVIDCITVWVSNILLTLPEDADAEAAISDHVAHLLRVFTAARVENVKHANRTRWILVSNEVGLGIVPPTSLGRRYRDALGRANQLLAAAAEDVTLMVAGLEMPLKQSRG